MTVTVLTPTFHGRDGLSCLSREMTRALVAICSGASIHVLALAGPGDRSPGGTRVCGCDGSRARFTARAFAAAARRPDIVLVLHTHMLPLALPFLAAGTSLAHVLVGIESWRALGPVESETLARARVVLAISAHTRDRFRASNPALVGPDIAVVHPSVPALPPAADGDTLPSPGYALIVGRMSADERYKGHDVLIESWPRVQAAVPGARLVVAGEGDDRARLERRARDAGLAAAIRFLGRVDDATLAALYARAGVFVLPSSDEGFGYVYLEAMQAGCACIGARGAAEEIIDDGVTGRLVDAGDARGVCDAVAGMLARPVEAQAMGRAGRQRIERYFSAARFERDLSAALQPVLPC